MPLSRHKMLLRSCEVVSLAAVFWMSRNAPPKERLQTSELHSFLIVLAVCLRSIEQTNHIPENVNDVRFRAKMWMWQMI